MDELSEMKKELADLRTAVNQFRERWDFMEGCWKEILLEHCQEFHLKIPDALLKGPESHP